MKTEVPDVVLSLVDWRMQSTHVFQQLYLEKMWQSRQAKTKQLTLSRLSGKQPGIITMIAWHGDDLTVL
jgi:hypothetical protein